MEVTGLFERKVMRVKIMLKFRKEDEHVSISQL